MNRNSIQLGLLVGSLVFCVLPRGMGDTSDPLPRNLQVVLDETQPLNHARGERLPLWVLPISGSLSRVDSDRSTAVLKALNERGIGYTVDWRPDRKEASLAETLRIGRQQQVLGMEVGVNANACLYSFFDGSEAMWHVDEAGERFAETSFGGQLGCPFTLESRYAAMKERLAFFLRGYRRAGIEIDFIFADWEIDGPIEWNGAWESSRRCQRCRQHVRDIDDFRVFQRTLRQLRSEMQRIVFGDLVRAYFPEALVGNYGVYPHEGHRYWYDYFEKESDKWPLRWDQRAPYREWYPEFPETGYSFAMPVVYTWYRIFQWYDYEETDYRWFYNMLKVGSNAGKATDAATPIIPFVHWHTTAPPESPEPNVAQFSEERYRELLWHLLLRGHDTFFLWCLSDELAEEIRLVHSVYRESLAHASYLNQGTPVTFEVPESPSTVLSGLRVGNEALVFRSDFGKQTRIEPLSLGTEGRIAVPEAEGLSVVPVMDEVIRDGFLVDGIRRRFPIGIYELPGDDVALEEMARAGINLFRCGSRADLDRVQRVGAQGWIALSVNGGPSDDLRTRIETVTGHPALAVWEGPDEIIWTYTAYSFLERVAGFTREDWNNQVPKAVNYARAQSKVINPNIRAAIQQVRELDPAGLPFWINEAADSDVAYARETVNAVDILGCDYYAVRATGTDLGSIGRLVKRWDAIGYQRPVWMVLQGFSWHTIKPERARLYPSFRDSRFMAYDTIVHGGRGVFYWGSNTIDDPAFRQSLYAVTRELSALEPFLVASTLEGVRANVIDDLFDPPGLGVRVLAKEMGTDVVVMLVNEDPHRHLGVAVDGLRSLEGRTMELFYGDERHRIERGGFATRMQPYEVKVFGTNPIFQATTLRGRDYVDPLGAE